MTERTYTEKEMQIAIDALMELTGGLIAMAAMLDLITILSFAKPKYCTRCGMPT